MVRVVEVPRRLSTRASTQDLIRGLEAEVVAIVVEGVSSQVAEVAGDVVVNMVDLMIADMVVLATMVAIMVDITTMAVMGGIAVEVAIIDVVVAGEIMAITMGRRVFTVAIPTPVTMVMPRSSRAVLGLVVMSLVANRFYRSPAHRSEDNREKAALFSSRPRAASARAMQRSNRLLEALLRVPRTSLPVLSNRWCRSQLVLNTTRLVRTIN